MRHPPTMEVTHMATAHFYPSDKHRYARNGNVFKIPMTNPIGKASIIFYTILSIFTSIYYFTYK